MSASAAEDLLQPLMEEARKAPLQHDGTFPYGRTGVSNFTSMKEQGTDGSSLLRRVKDRASGVKDKLKMAHLRRSKEPACRSCCALLEPSAKSCHECGHEDPFGSDESPSGTMVVNDAGTMIVNEDSGTAAVNGQFAARPPAPNDPIPQLSVPKESRPTRNSNAVRFAVGTF